MTKKRKLSCVRVVSRLNIYLPINKITPSEKKFAISCPLAKKSLIFFNPNMTKKIKLSFAKSQTFLRDINVIP